MNPILQSLKTRRSCRKYKPEQITREELEAVLEAGTYAPTGHGSQSPQMVVIQDKSLRDRLSVMNAAVMGATSDPFYGAPTAVIVFYDSTNSNGFADGCMVMGNLLNAAHAAGLASCYINRAREMFETPEGEELKAAWGVAPHMKGVAICILGYEDGGIFPPKPRKADYIIYA
ncbi:MAG: nitroreductase [Akkermansia sp.]|nr:nitroreductase [Akkermansia sp.]